ncbi:carbohydrate binding domain-containing protein [Vibrio variabilis]|uniref:carbohydrate binding domain-containing protein n=1 Tax=Vibrio variabilis TaxID=990271 RepID=UPI001EFA0ECB|nr:carbohydrate binding domain-containing protein [Vibrio variabilis]
MTKLNKVSIAILCAAFHSSGALSDEMIRNGDFSHALDGWWTAGASATPKNGFACMDIKSAGSDAWSVILGHAGIGLEQGEKYSISFDAYASTDTQMKTLIQHEGPPTLTTSSQKHNYRPTQKAINMNLSTRPTVMLAESFNSKWEHKKRGQFV